MQGCIAKHHSNGFVPTYCMEAQWKLRYSQEGLKKKKSTEKSRLAKSLLGSSKALVPWLHHTLQATWGAEGELLRRGLPTGLFSVFRLPSVSLLPIPGAWCGGRLKAVLLAEHFAAQPPDRLGLGEQFCLQRVLECYFQQNLGRKPKKHYILKVRPYTFACTRADGSLSLFGPERRFTWVNMLLGNYRKG